MSVSRPATPPAPSLAADWKSPEGYQDARWGMNPDEVARVVTCNDSQTTSDGFECATQIADWPATVKYSFVEGRLARAVIYLPPDGDVRSQYNRVGSLLKTRHAAPTQVYDSEEEVRSLAVQQEALHAFASFTGLGRLLPLHPVIALGGMAQRERIGPGYNASAQWDGAETRVLLYGHEDPTERVLLVSYVSTALWSALERQDREAQDADQMARAQGF
jgi:hypothetical protein